MWLVWQVSMGVRSARHSRQVASTVAKTTTRRNWGAWIRVSARPTCTTPRSRYSAMRAAKAASMAAFAARCGELWGEPFRDYDALHAWSIRHRDLFWSAVWDHCGVVGEKGGDAARVELRLEFEELLALDDPHVLDAILLPALHQLVEERDVVLVARDDERAVALVPKVKLTVERREHLVAWRAVLGADRARLVVETCVHDPAVSLGRALRHIIRRLEHEHRCGRL